MSASIALIRPEGDATERAMSTWAAGYATAVSGDPDISVTSNLVGTAATRTATESAAQAADALLYFGHGKRASLGKTTAVLDAHNVQAVADCIVVAFACWAGDAYGPAIVSQGAGSSAKAFIGFDDYLMVYKNPASMCGSGFELALTRLTATGAVRDVFDTMRDELKAVWDDYMFGSKKGAPDAKLIALGARFNRRVAVLLGDATATLPAAQAPASSSGGAQASPPTGAPDPAAALTAAPSLGVSGGDVVDIEGCHVRIGSVLLPIRGEACPHVWWSH